MTPEEIEGTIAALSCWSDEVTEVMNHLANRIDRLAHRIDDLHARINEWEVEQ